MHQIWKTEYLQNGIVKPYGNKIMHPVTATKAVAKIIQISKNQRSGLFHLGSEHSISFFDYCVANALNIGIDPSKIVRHNLKSPTNPSRQTPNLISNT